MSKIKVLLADDHRMVRTGIRNLLQQAGDIEVVAEVDSGEQAVALATASGAEVILMDISMPGLNGLEATRQIKLKYPDLRVLMLSMHEEPEYVIRAMKSGSSGYVLKSADRDELLNAVRRVHSGEKYYSPGVAGIMLEDGPSAQNHDPNLILTARERQILHLVANGKVTKEIAEELNISPRTVETHRVNIMRKLDVANTAELIKLAVLYKLVEA
ncbi:MAG: response regulator transcription factor [Bacteroidetes bacterium]|nr:response regulator transcription factor [Bacteroidota bacterium]